MARNKKEITGKGLSKLVEKAGSAREAAKLLGVSHTAVNTWLAEHAEASQFDEWAEHLVANPVKPCRFGLKGTKPNHSGHIPVLMMSDLHVGEVVTRGETGGLNEYNPAIERKRFNRIVQGTLDIYKSHLASYKYDYCVLLLGGDMVSGSIHDELAATDSGTKLEQALRCADLVRSTVAELKYHFGKVQVIAVTGNHGRLTHKIWHKQRNETSLDWLVTKVVQRDFDGDDAVHFTVADGYSVTTNIGPVALRLEHGDKGSGGGGGWLGAITPALRGAQKRKVQAMTTGARMDLLAIGHYHTYLHTPSVLMNGSLIGPSAFSCDLGFSPERPQQASFLIHQKHGVVLSAPIFASGFNGGRYVDY